MWRQGKLVIGLFAAGQDAVTQISDDTTIEARSEAMYLVGNRKALSGFGLGLRPVRSRQQTFHQPTGRTLQPGVRILNIQFSRRARVLVSAFTRGGLSRHHQINPPEGF